MIVKPNAAKVDTSERTGITERARVSLGQKVIASAVGGLAMLLLIGTISWRLFNKSTEAIGTTAISANVAPEGKGPGDLDAPPDIKKPCPPGIDCSGAPKAVAGVTPVPSESEEEAEARLRRLQQEELLREIVIQRRLTSELMDKKTLVPQIVEAQTGVQASSLGGVLRTSLAAPRAAATLGKDNANPAFVYPQAQSENAKPATNASASVNELERQLTPTSTPGTVAGFLPNRTLMVAKGQSATCVLDVALSSEQPGFVRCVLDFPVMSADGKATMMERGTTIDGEYRKGVDRGVRSAFVLWTRAVTPDGVYINLDSPATDGLGRTGIPGEVDSRFWDRYKGALLFSVLQDITQIGTGMLSAFGVTGPYGIPLPQNVGTSTSTVAAEIMKRDADVKDVLVTNQGKTIGITFARDLDFSTVYALKLKKSM